MWPREACEKIGIVIVAIFRGGTFMKKVKVLKIVNLLLFLTFISQASTGIGQTYIGADLLTIIHRIGGILLLIFAVTHLILNWGWVKANFLKAKGDGSKDEERRAGSIEQSAKGK
ncbi:MAG: DUF4405 domain-containing protein [Proteobacteria bacterium]|nr:DUF4405 domain-containing protein [Pseudomonadota bacterium]